MDSKRERVWLWRSSITNYLVVSSDGGRAALKRLDDRLAYDLAGIANVFTIDDDAAWALTDVLGKPLSCYSGAVRMYWPQLDVTRDPYRHPLWTASKLRSLDQDARRACDRFRRQMRRMVMHASAVSVVRPREIAEIRNAAGQAELLRMKARAKSLEDFEKLAESYSKENDGLHEELRLRDEELADLQRDLAKMEDTNRTLRFHLLQAGSHAGGAGGAEDDLAPDVVQDETVTQPPQKGEVRFYKKKYAARTHDVLVPVGDCGHDSWQGAAKADKAKKGIAKLEDRDDWRKVNHCAKCTGGGMWRVTW